MAKQILSQPRDSNNRHSSIRHECTPPDRGIQLPLTPPSTTERTRQTPLESNVGEATRLLASCREHAATNNIASFSQLKLAPEQYEELLEKLQADRTLGGYIADKVRFDYEPHPGLLTIRMPSAVHDFFKTFLTNDIRDQLKRIATTGVAESGFAAKIADGCSSRILLEEGTLDGDSQNPGRTVRREPDGQFQHRDAAYPGVVLEVSYSQDGKDLRKLAADYILGSNGDIKAVIGIDINYGKDSTVSLWRPRYVREDGEDLDTLEVEQELLYQPFRNSDGLPTNTEERLCLALSDFATDAIPSSHGSSVSILFEQLADFLTQAEQITQSREPDGGRQGIKSNRRVKKRRPSSSPAEDLRSEDEAEYRRREGDAVERAAAEDGDFRLPAPKRRV